jgi:hypothetical protein
MAGLLAVLAVACVGGGGGSATTGSNPVVIPPTDPIVDPTVPRTRYSLNNKCVALKSNANGKHVAASGSSYAATADQASDGAKFFMKPAALGKYLLYTVDRRLLTGGAPATTSAVTAQSGAAVWVVTAVGDNTVYPPAPQFNIEPGKAEIDAYRAFVGNPAPDVTATAFRLLTENAGAALAVDGEGTLTTAATAGGTAESFTFAGVTGCAEFPEAQSNVAGQTFSGTASDGRVLGMADVHVHIGSTTFLGGALHGAPFHKFGVQVALADCAETHGEGGGRDVIGGFLSGGGDPRHDTTGWPDFVDWPAARNLTHQAIYWKWLERAWLAGLRIAVNDLVENGTLCELQRNNSNDPSTDCNEMNSAGKQAGTMYAMQDYIDAQYGGRGIGWLRIVHGPDEARSVIAGGRLAMVLGIEISNFLNCQLTYNPNPARKEPFEEPEAGNPASENTYACTKETLVEQMDRIHGWGVRQVISIHEFDNAFGGNGIFFPIINVGNRENSGGIPGGTFSGDFETDPESPTGEFWTTYDCPVENETVGFSGYLWEDQGGASGEELRGFAGVPSCDPGSGQCLPCAPTGQGGRYGGTTACYPDAQQCNARWMTPIGLFMYGKLMEKGFIFDFDHMELHMKSQALELAEAQPIAYPFVSTHGTFGGTSNDQALRVLKNGGFLYPSLGGSADLRAQMDETRALLAGVPNPPLFGFGFGTDTNGLSGQAGPEPGVTYPFTLFDGGAFEGLPEFGPIAGLTFQQPNSLDADGNEVRRWSINEPASPDHPDDVGSVHQGMLAEMVRGMAIHGTPQQMRDLFNSAERFLLTWTRTELARAEIAKKGGVTVPDGVLRASPTPGDPYPPEQ